MSRFDITQTNIAVECLLETTTNPRHRWLLQAYNRHRYLEMAGRWKDDFEVIALLRRRAPPRIEAA